MTRPPPGRPYKDPWDVRKGKPDGSYCMDCGANTSMIHEFYMLKDEVWLSIVPDGLGMLCIGDAERRLERQLTAYDFDPAWEHLASQQSFRLKQRMEAKPRSVRPTPIQPERLNSEH